MISIVIPTHNRLGKLKSCVRSFTQQSAVDQIAEIVIVDDGSCDGTRDWLARAVNGALPFPLIGVSQKQRGPAAARNQGIERATGGVVLFTGDDCIAAPDLVAGHLGAHAASSDDHSVLGYTTWMPSLEISPFMHFQENGGSQFAYDRIRDPLDAGWNFYYTTNVSTPRRVLEQHRFNEQFTAARFEDMELGYRLERAGCRTQYHNDLVVWHDHVIEFGEFRSLCRDYGRYAAFFYSLHPEPELARLIGIADAVQATSALGRGLRWAELSVQELEQVFKGSKHGESEATCFGSRGSTAILADCYRLLIHWELIGGIREALGLAPLQTGLRDRSAARPVPVSLGTS